MNKFVSALLLCLLCCIPLSFGCSKSRIELAIASQPNVNPDHSGRPSPVIVKVLELRSDLVFKQAEFQTMFDTPLQVLGADLVAADELVFIPGEARRVAYQPTPNTKWIGIVAGFRQIDRALWRIIKPVDPKDKNWLSFELNDASIILVPDKDAKDWNPENAVRQYQQRLTPPPQSAGSPPPAPGNQETTIQIEPQQNQPLTSNANGRSAASPLSQALDNTAETVGTVVDQEAKEIITVITQDGVESFPGGVDTLSTPPSTQNAPRHILPGMRSM